MTVAVVAFGFGLTVGAVVAFVVAALAIDRFENDRNRPR